jgi:hypothetical protein
MYIHQQTNKETKEIKEECYNLLEKNINKIASSNIKIVFGVFNAKVGKENIYKPTTGNKSLRNETNYDKTKMIQFAIFNGFNVRSTTFPHKDIHKETWHSAGGRSVNQIDKVLISNKFRSAITDIRALREPDIRSDHNLLKINFDIKLRVKTEKKYNEKRKIVNIFQNSKWKKEYAI